MKNLFKSEQELLHAKKTRSFIKSLPLNRLFDNTWVLEASSHKCCKIFGILNCILSS